MLCQQIKDQLKIPEGQPTEFQGTVIADYVNGANFFCFEGKRFRWVVLKTQCLVQAVAAINTFLDDAKPDRLIIHCFKQFIGTHKTGEIMESIRLLRQKAGRVPWHKVVFCSMPFDPILEAHWEEIGDMNVYSRNQNVSMSRTPLNAHKALLKRTRGLKKLHVRGDCYEEKRTNVGLGATLSIVGMGKIEVLFGKHFQSGFNGFNSETGLTVNEHQPEPLQITPGYKFNPFMIELIKRQGTYDKNLRPTKKPKGARNDILHPVLATIGRRRPSTATEYSDHSSGSAYGRRSNSSGSAGSGRSSAPASRRSSRASVSGASAAGPSEAGASGSRADQDDAEQERHIAELRAELFKRINSDMCRCRVPGNANAVKDIQSKLDTAVKEHKSTVEHYRRQRDSAERCRREDRDRFIASWDKLHAEVDWLAHTRRSLEDKVIRLEQDLARIREERDHLRDQGRGGRDQGRGGKRR